MSTSFPPPLSSTSSASHVGSGGDTSTTTGSTTFSTDESVEFTLRGQTATSPTGVVPGSILGTSRIKRDTDLLGPGGGGGAGAGTGASGTGAAATPPAAKKKPVYLNLVTSSGASNDVTQTTAIEETVKGQIAEDFSAFLDEMVKLGVIQESQRDDVSLSLGSRALEIVDGQDEEGRDIIRPFEIPNPKTDPRFARAAELLDSLAAKTKPLSNCPVGKMKMGIRCPKVNTFPDAKIAQHLMKKCKTSGDFLRECGGALLADEDPERWPIIVRRLAYVDKFREEYKAELDKEIRAAEMKVGTPEEVPKYVEQLKSLRDALDDPEYNDPFALYCSAAILDPPDREFTDKELLEAIVADDSIGPEGKSLMVIQKGEFKSDDRKEELRAQYISDEQVEEFVANQPKDKQADLRTSTGTVKPKIAQRVRQILLPDDKLIEQVQADDTIDKTDLFAAEDQLKPDYDKAEGVPQYIKRLQKKMVLEEEVAKVTDDLSSNNEEGQAILKKIKADEKLANYYLDTNGDIKPEHFDELCQKEAKENQTKAIEERKASIRRRMLQEGWGKQGGKLSEKDEAYLKNIGASDSLEATLIGKRMDAMNEAAGIDLEDMDIKPRNGETNYRSVFRVLMEIPPEEQLARRKERIESHRAILTGDDLAAFNNAVLKEMAPTYDASKVRTNPLEGEEIEAWDNFLAGEPRNVGDILKGIEERAHEKASEALLDKETGLETDPAGKEWNLKQCFTDEEGTGYEDASAIALAKVPFTRAEPEEYEPFDRAVHGDKAAWAASKKVRDQEREDWRKEKRDHNIREEKKLHDREKQIERRYLPVAEGYLKGEAVAPQGKMSRRFEDLEDKAKSGLAKGVIKAFDTIGEKLGPLAEKLTIPSNVKNAYKNLHKLPTNLFQGIRWSTVIVGTDDEKLAALKKELAKGYEAVDTPEKEVQFEAQAQALIRNTELQKALGKTSKEVRSLIEGIVADL